MFSTFYEGIDHLLKRCGCRFRHKSAETPLLQQLRSKIKMTGAISVSDYMKEVLTNPSAVSSVRIHPQVAPPSDIRLQATNMFARSIVSIEQSQGFQTVRCLIGC